MLSSGLRCGGVGSGSGRVWDKGGCGWDNEVDGEVVGVMLRGRVYGGGRWGEDEREGMLGEPMV
jgi:hypothetical protein